MRFHSILEIVENSNWNFRRSNGKPQCRTTFENCPEPGKKLFNHACFIFAREKRSSIGSRLLPKDILDRVLLWGRGSVVACTWTGTALWGSCKKLLILVNFHRYNVLFFDVYLVDRFVCLCRYLRFIAEQNPEVGWLMRQGLEAHYQGNKYDEYY